MKHVFSSLAIATVFLAPTSSAQSTRPASNAILRQLGVAKASLQDLSLPANERKSFSLRLVLDQRVRTLRLRPHSVLSPGFELRAGGSELQTIPTPTEVTYRGEVDGEPVSGVAAALRDGSFEAYIYIGSSNWSVQPLRDVAAMSPASTHVTYRHLDILATDVRCGQGARAVDPRVPQASASRGGQPNAVLRECEIALDCNNEYYARNGRNTTRTFQAATALINQVDVIYRREVEICYRIPTILIRTTKVYQNGPQVGCVSGPDLLEEFRTRWRNSHTNIHRDVAHMLSGWGSWSGIIGCASLSVVCSQRSGFAVSRVVNSNAGRNTGLVAHELGHNWSSGHCNSAPPCYIMCSGIGGCARDLTRFSTFAKTRINNFKNSRTCLSDCCPAASYTYFGSPCRGSGPGDGLPDLAVVSAPKLGGSLAVRVAKAKASSPAILMHAVQTANVDLGPFGAAGCRLYVQSLFFSSVVVTSNLGTAQFPALNIPNLSALCGVRFFDQVLVVDNANRLGLVFSRRGQPVVGS